jgi:CubicO group peptidase (beta-lactamase class C family)
MSTPRTLLTHVLAIGLSLFVLLGATVSGRPAAQDVACGAAVQMRDGWSIASAGEAGLDERALCGLDNFIARWPRANIHGVVIARHGRLAFERYYAGNDEHWGTPVGTVRFAADVKHDLRSITKSVVSLLIGIAASEGRFPPLDSPVLDFFPEYQSLRTPAKAALTFRHLLTMSAGLEWDESLAYSDPRNSEIRMIASSDPVGFVLKQPLATAPGSAFRYSGGATTVLGAALERSTRTRMEDYAKERLFRPLAIDDTEWVRMPNGMTSAASGLRMRPRDIAKLGKLLLNDGTADGRRIIPRGWVVQSIQSHRPVDAFFSYGYQWWTASSRMGASSYPWSAGVGYGGQRLFAQPDLDLIVVITAGHYGDALQNVIPLAIFTQFILPATRS